tara:strand:+ start:69 stop:1286 length:1218 start_codon:yes stop_codon:yes gene_type:complete
MSDINFLYHSVECDAVNQSGYTEFDTLDYQLDFSGRAMIAGSIRFEAEIQILNAGAVITDAQRIAIDHMIGAHSVVQSCVSSTLNSGVVENVTNLPRLVAMKTNATKHRNDMMNSDMVCELRSPDMKIQEKLMKRRMPADVGGGLPGVGALDKHTGSAGAAFAQYSGGNAAANETAYQNTDFSFKPHIVFNNVVGSNRLINYSTTGTVKLSLNLGRNNEVLYGADMTGDITYLLTNARICFTSVPEPAKQSPVSLRSSICLKSNLNSQLSNTSNRVPGICDSCSVSFMQLARENSRFFSNTELEMPPNIDALRFMFNSSTNKYLAFELKTKPEIIAEGLRALATGTGSNNITLDKLMANKSFTAGLKFGEQIDLSKQRFNIQLSSAISNTSPYVMFAYFHSLISL